MKQEDNNAVFWMLLRVVLGEHVTWETELNLEGPTGYARKGREQEGDGVPGQWPG